MWEWMSTPDVTPDESESGPAEREETVSAICTSPDRVVFTEDGNPDGWIATDVAVDPEQ
ncbi:MAG: hypothetical protein A07HR60_00886 [uncultured archaeon A07HR60]|nr:MAG: hypothetical protein A07HR60_00886 [uncultured archaeon A07HR60]